MLVSAHGALPLPPRLLFFVKKIQRDKTSIILSPLKFVCSAHRFLGKGAAGSLDNLASLEHVANGHKMDFSSQVSVSVLGCLWTSDSLECLLRMDVYETFVFISSVPSGLPGTQDGDEVLPTVVYGPSHC